MNIVIMGGGKVGESLARRILEGRRHEVRIIESDRARSLQLANALDVEIICGDGTNIDMLENAGVRDADCFIAISGDDANNLVASQLAKQYFGAKKVIARANDPRNLETMRVLGMDYAVSSTEIIAQMIEQEANLMEFHLVASLNKGRGEMREQIDSTAKKVRPQKLILDFKEVPFMDSSGIGLILGRVRTAALWGGHVTVRGLSPQLKKMAELSGVSALAVLEDAGKGAKT